MSGSQQLALFTNVNAVGAGSAETWNGGPAVVMAWWSGGNFAAGVTLQVSPDSGSHWADIQGTSADLAGSFNLNTNNNGQAAMSALNLPPCTVRAFVNGATNPTNMNVVMVGYDDALKTFNAS